MTLGQSLQFPGPQFSHCKVGIVRGWWPEEHGQRWSVEVWAEMAADNGDTAKGCYLLRLGESLKKLPHCVGYQVGSWASGKKTEA